MSGAGCHRLSVGKGQDRLGGGPGADALRSKGGVGDIVMGGPGRDEVVADGRDKPRLLSYPRCVTPSGMLLRTYRHDLQRADLAGGHLGGDLGARGPAEDRSADRRGDRHPVGGS